jgi:hypothetical protein
MTDETQKPHKLGLASIDEQLANEENTKDEKVTQLMQFRNIRLYLDKMIGKQWLLMYRREDDGAPVYVPNEYLLPEDQVFLAELAKHLTFSMMGIVSEDDY